MHPRGRTAASLRVATAVLIALACCSCTSRPLQGMLVPTSEAVEAGAQVPVLVATTRMRSSGDPGEMFSRELSSEMAFGQVTVSIPPDNARTVGEIQWPSSPPGDPRRDFVTASAGYLDRAGFSVGALRRIYPWKSRRCPVTGLARGLTLCSSCRDSLDECFLRQEKQQYHRQHDQRAGCH